MSREAVRGYVDQALHDGFTDREFFGLLEIGEAAVPELIEQIQCIEDQTVRINLVQVLWQIRSNSTQPFLFSLLENGDDQIWNAALDGIVAIGGTEAERGLERLLDRFGGERRERIREALLQSHSSGH